MYTELAEIPVPIGGQFVGPDADTVEITFSVRDHELNLKKTVVKTIANIQGEKPYVSPPVQVDSQVAALYSPSGKRKVVLREVNKKGDTRRVVELWNESTKVASVDVTERHDKFYVDEYIGSLGFNATEDAVVYTAEAHLDNDSSDPYAKFRYRPDFGEGLTGQRRPALFIVKLPGSPSSDDKPVVYRLKSPANVRLGQAVFSGASTVDEVVLYATGYELQPDGRLLGVKGCFNRPTGIWRVKATLGGDPTVNDVDATATKLNPGHISCRSPRVVPQGKGEQLVFLSSASGGPHVTTASLQTWKPTGDGKGEVREVIGIVEKPAQGDWFPGLYPPYNLPAAPYLSQTGSLAFHSHVGSKTWIVLAGLDGKRSGWDRVPEDSDEGEMYSWSVLATDEKNRILCWRSSPSVPYEIGVADVRDGGITSWKSLDKPKLPERVSKALSSIRTSIHQIPDRAPTETLVITSTLNGKGGKLPPCVLVPHGGPHATTTTAFSPATTALVLEGFTLALPNYTGSLGYGEAPIRALVGACGRTDVDDCIGTLDHLVKIGIAEDGPGRVFVQGGSHGGFLSAHLIGQFPDRFSGAVMRNPVISVGEISTTDIPDWYFSEFGYEYPVLSSTAESTDSQARNGDPDSIAPLMTGQTFTQLQSASPIHHVDKVKAPVLLLVGLADRRVAPTHGVEYYHALTARARKVELLTFEGESHPLDGVEAARVCWEAGRDWLRALAS
ncbi:acylaminoacyl-peptidase [Coprinopsis cinerea okayama7|uniref:acylaminoacyl-peptidase n=1 Tax=Coprinopsis cinerea (strain Okayama-7 / 130 / ATCC MYA-4618 / FGSC 9003) TaxID=240176 RepID=D6RQ15_COPC7|nr:acylaminoacyl-peptidase [Coprinopsis cinerea okayama7\|eukprot:XP_002910429.1 acylaminoacyl-peptidase [Coprinopsis cinerea okayama7\